MTRMWRIGLASVVVAIVVLLGICSVDPATAAKPGGGAHTSRIYYYTWRNPYVTYQMYEDGSSKTPVNLPPGVIASPSSKVYGGSHWWLTTDIDLNTGFAELFAYYDEDGDPPVQLTLAGADVSFGLDERNVPRWSNDGQDRFVTFNAGTIEGGYLCRLWITDDDIAAIQLGAPPFTAADIEFVLPHPLGYFDYSWSNNDGMLAYLTRNYDNAVSRTIWVRALTDPPSDVPIYTRTNAEGSISIGGSWNHFQWSPNGSRIAFSTDNRSSYGGVWTIKPDGTGLVKVKTNSGTMSYFSRGWSPNSTELLLEIIKARIGDWYYNLARMPAGGGTLTTLTNDLPETLGKTVRGWVPLSP